MSAAAPAPSPWPIRIGLDGRALEGSRTGVGRYVSELCGAMRDVLPADAEVFVYARRPVEMPIADPRWHLRVEPREALARLPASVWLKLRAPRLIARDDVSAFWGTATLLPHLPRGVRLVSTVYDLNHLVAPETMPRTTLAMHRATLARDLRRADAVVAISRGTRDRLAAMLGVPTTAVVVPAVSRAFSGLPAAQIDALLATLDVPTPFFLAVGTREPRKNLALLVRAFRERLDGGEVGEHALVLCGGAGWRDGALDAELARLPRDRVRVLGYVSDEALAALYVRTTAFVFPSRYEGFGIPVLEARAAGARIIATDLPELREAGGDAPLYVEPTVAAIGAALVSAARGALAPATPIDAEATWRSGATAMAAILCAR